MCEAMRELMKEDFEKAEARGVAIGEARGEARGRKGGEISMLVRLVEKGRLSVEEAASEVNMTAASFKELYLTPALA